MWNICPDQLGPLLLITLLSDVPCKQIEIHREWESQRRLCGLLLILRKDVLSLIKSFFFFTCRDVLVANTVSTFRVTQPLLSLPVCSCFRLDGLLKMKMWKLKQQETNIELNEEWTTNMSKPCSLSGLTSLWFTWKRMKCDRRWRSRLMIMLRLVNGGESSLWGFNSTRPKHLCTQVTKPKDLKTTEYNTMTAKERCGGAGCDEKVIFSLIVRPNATFLVLLMSQQRQLLPASDNNHQYLSWVPAAETNPEKLWRPRVENRATTDVYDLKNTKRFNTATARPLNLGLITSNITRLCLM